MNLGHLYARGVKRLQPVDELLRLSQKRRFRILACAQAAFKVLSLEGITKRAFQQIGRETAFVQIIRRSGLQSSSFNFMPCKTGQKDKRGVTAAGSRLAYQIDAVIDAQPIIDQTDIMFLTLNAFKSLSVSAGGVNEVLFASCLTQEASDPEVIHTRVVDDKNFERRLIDHVFFPNQNESQKTGQAGFASSSDYIVNYSRPVMPIRS